MKENPNRSSLARLGEMMQTKNPILREIIQNAFNKLTTEPEIEVGEEPERYAWKSDDDYADLEKFLNFAQSNLAKDALIKTRLGELLHMASPNEEIAESTVRFVMDRIEGPLQQNEVANLEKAIMEIDNWKNSIKHELEDESLKPEDISNKENLLELIDAMRSSIQKILSLRTIEIPTLPDDAEELDPAKLKKLIKGLQSKAS